MLAGSWLGFRVDINDQLNFVLINCLQAMERDIMEEEIVTINHPLFLVK